LRSLWVVILLIGIGYWLMTSMRRQSAIEDCLMQQRRDCDRLTR